MTHPEPDAASDSPERPDGDPDGSASTELAGVADAATQSAYAWGLSGEAATEAIGGRQYSPSWITVAVVAASVAVIVAAGAVAWAHLRTDSTAPTPPQAAPTPTTAPAPVPQAPATVTTVIVQPPAPTASQPAATPPSPTYDGFDEQFVAIMQRAGWTKDSPVFLARRGRQVCSMLQGGATPDYVKQRIVTDSGLPWDQAVLFTDTAMSVYPGCP